MERDEAPHIPDHLSCAAFLVEDNVITEVNAAAEHRQITAGTNILGLICVGSTEYSSFRSGKLYLQLNIAGIRYHTSVTCHHDAHLFCILSSYSSSELQALALAASHLREPLQNALNGIEQLTHISSVQSDPSTDESIGQINRSLYQLIRTIGNMSDASESPQSFINQMQWLDAKAVFTEIAEKLKATLPPTDRNFSFDSLPQSVYSMLDRQALERAIYNLVSNAFKFSPDRSTIRVKLSNVGSRILITVENTCDQSRTYISQLFESYLREPGIEDIRFGIGLGLSVVRNIAAAHNGTLLIDRGNKNTIRFTIALAVRDESANMLKSPLSIKIDRTGGFDMTYVELSDILPDEMYKHI